MDNENLFEEDWNENDFYSNHSIEDDINAINVVEVAYPIFSYLRMLEKGRLIIDPDFQRNIVWSKSQKSSFIESIILNYPLPPIYLNETIDSNYIVIDGLQRSVALQQFYAGQYELHGLKVLSKYNGCRFDDLPIRIRARIEEKSLIAYVLKPSTPIGVIYDLFYRINTGGTQLNRQEIRNGIYTGKSTVLLKELASQDYFKKAIDWGVSDTRMKDREVVLRYLSFRWFDYESEYTGDLGSYLESAMKRINKMDDVQIELIRFDFERVMRWVYKIWQGKGFRLPTKNNSLGTINVAVLEVVCNYLSRQEEFFLVNNEDIIRDNYYNLIQIYEFQQVVSKSTGNKYKVFERFKLAYEFLDINTK